MKRIHRLVSLILAVGMLIVIGCQASAVSSKDVSNTVNVSFGTSSSIPETTDVTVSDPMSFEEISRELAEVEGISLEEAKNLIDPSHNENARSTAATYRTLSHQFEVDAYYKPTMSFYCRTEEASGYLSGWGIAELCHATMIRSYENLVKLYNGDMYVELRSPYQIYYIVNGDFYNTGTQNTGITLGLHVGEALSFTFTIQGATNYYNYCYVNNLCNFQK